jgi:hypothetical protein
LTLLIPPVLVEIAKDRTISTVGYDGIDRARPIRLTPFHCHQQLHMDYGFKTLFRVE